MNPYFLTLANQHLEVLRQQAEIERLHQKQPWTLSRLLPTKKVRPSTIHCKPSIAAK